MASAARYPCTCLEQVIKDTTCAILTADLLELDVTVLYDAGSRSRGNTSLNFVAENNAFGFVTVSCHEKETICTKIPKAVKLTKNKSSWAIR